MNPATRVAAYFRQKPGAMTPKQRRRYRSKVLRGLSDRLPGLLHDPADGAGSFDPFSTAPAPTPTALDAAGVGVTPDSVASASTYATDGAPQTTQDAAHAPTVAATGPVTVGASPSRVEGCDAEYPSVYASPSGGYVCRCTVCARCGHHTGNSHQGHYWRMCKVSHQLETFHFCCPDNCELTPSDATSPVTVGASPRGEPA